MFGYKRDTSLLASVGSAEHRAVASKAVRESLVVLQNNNVLPLAKAAKVWVVGSGSNSLKSQTGGWTIGWQGNGSDGKGTGNDTTGTTIILYGTVKPIGKLSHSWPKTNAQVNVNFGDAGYDPLFKLGFGLAYP